MLGILVSVLFLGYVVYSFFKGVGQAEDGVELVAYLAGIGFVLWLVGSIFG